MVFSKRNILIPNVAEKNILILVEEKKSDSEYLSYNLMLNSGKKNILTLTKNHKPPCKLNARSLILADINFCYLHFFCMSLLLAKQNLKVMIHQ